MTRGYISILCFVWKHPYTEAIFSPSSLILLILGSGTSGIGTCWPKSHLYGDKNWLPRAILRSQLPYGAPTTGYFSQHKLWGTFPWSAGTFQLVPPYLVPPPVERQGRLWLGLNHKKYQDLCPQWVHPRIKLSVINKVWFNRCTGQVIRKAHKTRLCGRMEQGPSEGFIFQAALALKFIFRHTNVLLCNKNHRDGFEGLLFRGAELPVSLGYLINSADHATKTWHYKKSLSIHTFLLTETGNSGSLGL